MLIEPENNAFSGEKPSVPNIVLILADDLGYGDVQCLDPERGKIVTPHLDRLAGQGMVFTDAHSGSSVCTPTRYGVLTGRYAWRTRLQSGVFGSNQPPLVAEGRLTVPELLRRHGYHTAAIGKWHLGYQYDRTGETKPPRPAKLEVPVGTRILGGPTTRGFDSFFGFSHARAMETLIENEHVAAEIEPVEMLPRLARRAADYIGQRARADDSRPLFLYLALSSPHTPIVPSAEWKGRSGLNPYADFVMQTDAAVGEVLAAIERHGAAENTLVIFTSDNGCSPAANIEELLRQGHHPSSRFRGHKADIWDGGHRIPFIVRWPGHVRAGSKSDHLICLTDLMATCAEMLGVKLPDDAAEDSVSFLPALRASDTRPLREAVVHHSISGRFAIRQGPWKLEFCPGSGGWSKPGDAEAAQQGLPSMQLYHMIDDPAEQQNLAAKQPEVVERLTRLIERYVADGRSTPGAAQKNDVEVDVLKADKGRANAKAAKAKKP